MARGLWPASTDTSTSALRRVRGWLIHQAPRAASIRARMSKRPIKAPKRPMPARPWTGVEDIFVRCRFKGLATVMIMTLMDAIHFPPSHSFDGALPLTRLGVIRAHGPDAATFLHGQLSQDVLGLDASQARLAAFCSAKGRMQASFILGAPAHETIDLLTDHSVLPAVLKRLSMFVMRSKLRLSDESGQRVVLGLCGSSGRERLELEGPVPPQAWQSVSWRSGAQVIALPDAFGVSRWLWLGTPEQASALTTDLPVLSSTQWAWLDVMSGVMHVEAATVDQFVPQMVNFELVGGVNFSKGCYPGQE